MAALLVGVAGALLLFGIAAPGSAPATGDTGPSAPARRRAGEPGRTIKARLFYVSEDGTRLTSVERDVPFAEGPEQAREIVNAQIAPVGPTPLGLGRAAPGRPRFARRVPHRAAGDATSISAARRSTAHPGRHTRTSCSTVYTIVNALTVNLPAVQIGPDPDRRKRSGDARRPRRSAPAARKKSGTSTMTGHPCDLTIDPPTSFAQPR